MSMRSIFKYLITKRVIRNSNKMIEIEGQPLRGQRFIDLFCGIGGFHLALSSFGAECVFASDIDENAKNVYEQNFGFRPDGDITQIQVDDIPEHDIICAGFPCQPFSISGDQQGFDDEKGRGKLFFNIVKIAQRHQPKIILLENVKNFKKHDNGETLKKVESELHSIGYTVFNEVLCATDFGIAQARKRIYIVAFRNDLKVENFIFPKPLDYYRTIEDFLITDNENDLAGNYIVEREDLEYDTQNNMENSKTLVRIGQKGAGRQGERIYSIRGQSTTLSSQGGGIGGKTGMYLINGHIRKLYPRECARLMGFPDDFQLANTQERCYKQFGNSVVVDVLQHILLKIVDLI